MELQEIHTLPRPKAILAKISSRLSKPQAEESTLQEYPDIADSLPSPITAAIEQKERWNGTKINVYRTLAAFWGFAIMGANDAAIGALIPYVINALK